MLQLLKRLFVKHHAEEELDDELEFHLRMRSDRNEVSGMTPEAARKAAQKQFGNRTWIREETRHVHTSVFWETLAQDVRYAIRSFRHAPGFTLTVILALALGTGATTAVFSFVDRILFRSLPYPHEERLVSVGVTAPLDSNEFVLAADYRDWKAADTPFESLGSFVAGGAVGGAGCELTGQNPVRLSCALIDAAFLPTLGIEPLLGRNFTAEEDRPNIAKVALISYALWQSRFGSDRNVVGQTVSLDEQPVRIIGVLPRSFEMPTLGPDDIFLPQALDPQSLIHPQTGVYLRVFGRLKPGWTIANATAAMTPLFQESLKWVPPAFRNEVHLRIRTLRDRQIQDTRAASLVLFGAVLTVLLVACANVANLLLARGAVRAREFAMRAALGAGRRRLVRQILTESLLLSSFGSLAGFALAWALLGVFRSLAPTGIPRLTEASLDIRIFLFTVGLSLIAGTLFGIAPALQTRGLEKAGARVFGNSGGALRYALVAVQIAASLVLLTAAGLLSQTLWNLERVPLGMQTEGVLTASMTLSQRYGPTAARLAFVRQLEPRIASLPGLKSFAIADSIPLLPGGNAFALFAGLEVSGHVPFAQGTGGTVSLRSVTEGYFATLGIPLLRGRSFTGEDRGQNADVVILNESLARRLFPAEDALGKQLRSNPNNRWRTIIGIVGNVKNNTVLSEADDPEFYVLYPQGIPRRIAVAIRTSISPDPLGDSVRSVVASIDPAIPVTIQTLDQQIQALVDRPRFIAVLLGFFSTVAVALAAIGLFGVVSFLVARRTQEIGVRIALGARSANVVTLVVSSALRWTILGILAGGVGSLLVTQSLKGLLFQVSEHDPRTLAFTIVVLVAIALISAWIPTRRASRIDPMEALRHD